MANHSVIISKALDILNLQDGDRVGVAGRSWQDFVSAATESAKDVSIHAFPVFENVIEDGKENPFGPGVFLHEEDFFTVELEVKFHKIFLDCPCELSAEEFSDGGQRYVYKMEFNQLPVKPQTSAEWIMISYAADHLPEGGKAVVVVDEEKYRNEADVDLRTYFEESGIIEEVVDLSGEILLIVLKG